MGRIVVMEFNDQDTPVFEEIVRVLERYSDFEKIHINDESVLSIPMLNIFPKRRKVFSEHNEISLTVKEFDLLQAAAETSDARKTIKEFNCYKITPLQIFAPIFYIDIFGS